MSTDVCPIPQGLLDFRETIRQMVRERVWPRAAEIDESGKYPHDIRELFASHDVLALPFPERYGGTGSGTLMQQIAVEEVAKACASSALILMVQELGTLPIQLFGSEELKERLLPRCASGEWSPAFALSESEAAQVTARPPLIGITSYAEVASWGVWSMSAALIPVPYVSAGSSSPISSTRCG